MREEIEAAAPGTAKARSRSRLGWTVIGVATFALLYASGLRSMFGVLIEPLEHEFGFDRATLGTVAALSLFLYGAVGPLAGRFSDAWSTRWILVLGVALLGAGELLAARANSLFAVYVTLGVIVAVGAGAVGMPSVTSLVPRWFAQRRGLVLGILSAGMSAGQILVIPAAAYVTERFGWRVSLIGLGVLALGVVVPLVAVFVRDRPPAADATSPLAQGGAEGLSLFGALGTLPFWLLAGSFFVCGYTSVGLVLTHFIPDCVDRGFSPLQASAALGVMGALNVVGTLGAGWVCDRFGRTLPLALFYVFRAVTLIGLIFVHDAFGLFAFAAAFGLNYIATVPPTSSLTARIFGSRSAGELYGWIFVSHQVGAALGAWAGGIVYAVAHTYTPAYVSAAALALLAASMVLAIRDAPRYRSLLTVPEAAAAI